MRALIIPVCLLLALFALPVSALAQSEFKVIVHPSNKTASLSKRQASQLFLKKTTKWPIGGKALAVDLLAGSKIRAAFSKAIHGRSTVAVTTYWQRQIFGGRGTPPPTKSTEEAVVAYVLAHPGAIGYVSAAADTKGAKTLQITSK